MLEVLSQRHHSYFSGSVGQLHEYRERKLNEARDLGMPSRQLESWHYTPLSELKKMHFSAVEIHNDEHNAGVLTSKSQIEQFRLGNVFLFTFVNGQLRADLSDSVLQNLVSVTSLSEALKTRSSEIRKWIDETPRSSRPDPNVFECINSAFLEHGLIIEVGAKTKLEKSIQILNISTSTEALATFTKVFIRLSPFAEATVIDSSIGDGAGLNSIFTYGDLREHSQLEYVRFSKSKKTQIDESNFSLMNFAKVTTANLVLSPILNRHSLNIFLSKESAEAYANGLSVLDAKQVSDNQVNIEHLVPRCQSRQLYKGMLSGQSKAIFCGRIYISAGAYGTDSAQINKNLILSRQAEADVKPLLEVFADDVKATHGAAIGRLDPEELFYLQSRGIPENESFKILANAFVDDVLLGIRDKEIMKNIRVSFQEAFMSIDMGDAHGS